MYDFGNNKIDTTSVETTKSSLNDIFSSLSGHKKKQLYDTLHVVAYEVVEEEYPDLTYEYETGMKSLVTNIVRTLVPNKQKYENPLQITRSSISIDVMKMEGVDIDNVRSNLKKEIMSAWDGKTFELLQSYKEYITKDSIVIQKNSSNSN